MSDQTVKAARQEEARLREVWRQAVKATAEQEQRDRERWAWDSPQKEASRPKGQKNA
ncbi:MAG: hypothetical protein LC650_00710 [Actinobacteria bacterium]|nr:hypothetical protein [Actinomycetota bacterium]